MVANLGHPSLHCNRTAWLGEEHNLLCRTRGYVHPTGKLYGAVRGQEEGLSGSGFCYGSYKCPGGMADLWKKRPGSAGRDGWEAGRQAPLAGETLAPSEVNGMTEGRARIARTSRGGKGPSPQFAPRLTPSQRRRAGVAPGKTSETPFSFVIPHLCGQKVNHVPPPNGFTNRGDAATAKPSLNAKPRRC